MNKTIRFIALSTISFMVCSLIFTAGYYAGREIMARHAWQCIQNRRAIQREAFSDACAEIIVEYCTCEFPEERDE